jgi:nitrogenase molybdenum-iron protein alpha/beta subunit
MSQFALSSVPPFLDGVYLAVNAVPDLCLLIDCPSGCFFKCERIALNHDSTSTLFDPMGRHRLVQSGVDFGRLALGSEPALSELARRAVTELRPAAVLLTQASPLVVTSSDLDSFAQRASAELRVPVRYIAPQITEGDFLDGFERALEAVAEILVDRTEPPRVEAGVALVGYFADRLEQDHRASLAELRRLLAALGLSCHGVMLDGTPLGELGAMLGAQTLLELPYAGSAARTIAARSGARIVQASLPIGLGGTLRWLERLVSDLSLDRGCLDRLIESELEQLVPTTDLARRRFLEGRRAVVAGEPEIVAGLVEFLAELSVDVPLVSVHARSSERTETVRQAVRRARTSTEIVHDVSVLELRNRVEALGSERAPHVVIGSALERDIARDGGFGFIELGYPSFLIHALSPRPLLGFAGARKLLDELVAAVQLADYSRQSNQ